MESTKPEGLKSFFENSFREKNKLRIAICIFGIIHFFICAGLSMVIIYLLTQNLVYGFLFAIILIPFALASFFYLTAFINRPLVLIGCTLNILCALCFLIASVSSFLDRFSMDEEILLYLFALLICLLPAVFYGISAVLILKYDACRCKKGVPRKR